MIPSCRPFPTLTKYPFILVLVSLCFVFVTSVVGIAVGNISGVGEADR